jgi:hypothetical protein
VPGRSRLDRINSLSKARAEAYDAEGDVFRLLLDRERAGVYGRAFDARALFTSV